METRPGFRLVVFVGAAAIVAGLLAAMAHEGLGIPRATIRFDALCSAAFVAAIWLAGPLLDRRKWRGTREPARALAPLHAFAASPTAPFAVVNRCRYHNTVICRTDRLQQGHLAWL